MKLIVMSDSHGYNANVLEIMEKEKDAYMFIHCGDLCDYPDLFPNLVLVRGNNDFLPGIPSERVIEIEGHKIYVCHSHTIYGGFIGKEAAMAKVAKQYGCDILLFGHTHMYCDTKVSGVRMINPGSLYYNRDGSKIGYVVLNITKNKVELSRKYL